MELISSTELWFLFSLYSPAVIIGFKNPVAGYLKKEIDSLKKEKERELLKKGFLTKKKSICTYLKELRQKMAHQQALLW